MTQEKLALDPASTPAQSIYKLLIGTVVPRPIAFVSTVSAEGVRNLAPFSFFQVICAEPPTVCFATGFRVPSKDTLVNVKATGEFVVNLVSEEIAEKMNLCSGDYPAAIDEFQVSGLTPVASDLVKPPYVLESHVNMECRLVQTVEISKRPMGGTLIIGEVVRFHIDGEIMENFRVDPDKLRAVGRMGGNEYTRTRERFQMVRPRV
jgi:flavin reductase (DIM6/NTAB) family NADH-FMN oxidoreductase RutF